MSNHHKKIKRIRKTNKIRRINHVKENERKNAEENTRKNYSIKLTTKNERRMSR